MDELFVFISERDDGIIAYRMPTGEWFPLVTARAENLSLMAPKAKIIDPSYRILKFTEKADITDEVRLGQWQTADL